MAEDKLELELDVNTKDAKEKLDKLANEYTQKKIRLGVEQSEIKKLEQSLLKYHKSIDDLLNGIDNPMNAEVKDQFNKYKELIQSSIRAKEEIKALRREMSKLSNAKINIDIQTPNIDELRKIISEQKINLRLDESKIVELNKSIAELKNAKLQLGDEFQKTEYLSRYKELMSELSSVSQRYDKHIKEAKQTTDAFNKALFTIEPSSNTISKTTNKVVELKDKLSSLENTNRNASSKLNSMFSTISKNVSNASSHVDEFSRRIFRLLRNAFVFNVISRGFRGLSNTLYNLIRRDTQLARSLLIVKANLIRAFAPIWQVVLPWIRALGRALVWLSNRLISFINYLAGREIIKPVKEIGEAQKVVGNFMKIASPKKEMFDLEKPAKKTKKLKDNTKKATKETNKLLASFDKLETLKFKKGGFAKDPFGLEELKKDKNGKDILNNGGANLEIKADTESVEQQIARAINQIEDQPLEFKVNDNIGEQITSEVNGLNLPTLDFKVDTDNNKLDDLKLKLNLVKDAIIGIATAATVYKVVSVLGNIVGIGASMIGPAGWLSLAAGLGVGLALAFKDMNQYLKDADGNLTPFGKSIEEVQEKLKPLSDEFKNWKDDVFPKLGDALNDIFKDFQKYLQDNPDFLKDVSKVLALILKLAGFGLWTNLKILRVMLKGVLDVVEAIYLTVKGIWNFIKDILDGLAMTSAHNFIKQKPIPALNGKIPGLAQGSVLNGGDPFLAYLNDQPRGQTNIEAPLDTMVTAFKQALSEGGYSGPTEINLEATGDMSQLIRFLNIKLSDERIRVGNSFVPGY